MVVFGFSGSPRRHANTDRLVQTVLAGAAEAGADIRFFRPQDMDLRPCRACMWCRENCGCSIEDQFSPLWPELYEADALVIGSPVYMWQMSAQAKTLVDRLYPVLNPDFSSRLAKNPKLVLCFTQGHPDGGFFKPYFAHTAQMLRFLGFDVLPPLAAVGTRAPEAIEVQSELLEQARAMGRCLAG